MVRSDPLLSLTTTQAQVCVRAHTHGARNEHIHAHAACRQQRVFYASVKLLNDRLGLVMLCAVFMRLLVGFPGARETPAPAGCACWAARGLLPVNDPREPRGLEWSSRRLLRVSSARCGKTAVDTALCAAEMGLTWLGLDMKDVVELHPSVMSSSMTLSIAPSSSIVSS